MPTTAMPKTTRIAMNACQVGLLASAREIAGRDVGPAGHAGDKPRQAEHADDEALPVAGHRECRDQRDQDQVEQVTGHSINL